MAIQTFPIQQLDYGAAVGEGQRLRQNDFILQEQQRKVQQQNALAQFYQQNGPGLASGDQNALDAYARIDPAGAQKFGGDAAEAKKKQLDATITKTNLILQAYAAVRNAPPGANKQALWDKIKGNLAQQYGIDTSQAMQTWDDVEADAHIQQGMSIKEQLEQAQKGVPPNFERVPDAPNQQQYAPQQISPPIAGGDPNVVRGPNGQVTRNGQQPSGFTGGQNNQPYWQTDIQPIPNQAGPSGPPVPIPNYQPGTAQIQPAQQRRLRPIQGGPADPDYMRQEALAKQIPPQPTAPLSPEAFEQQKKLRDISASRGAGTAGGGRTLTERNRSIVINGNPSSPEYAAAYADMAKPRVLFDPNTGETIEVAPDMTWARKPGGGAAPQGAPPIPGAGRGEGRPEITTGPGRSASPTQATFQSNVTQATEDVTKAEKMLFPGAAYKDGKLGGGTFDRGMAFTGGTSIPGAGPGVPFTKGREARQTIRRAVEIILRLRTGAAAPDTEVDNYTNLYAPSALDNDSGARTKMERLRQFFEESKEIARSKLPQRGAASPAPMGGGGGQPLTASGPNGERIQWNGSAWVPVQ